MSERYTTVGPIVTEFATAPVYEIVLNKEYPHSFVGVIPCDADGDFVAASAGTASFKVMTVGCPGVWQTPTESTKNLNDPGDVSFGGNITMVQITIAGLVGATHTRAYASQNLS